MNLGTLLSVAIIVFTGLFFGKIITYLRLPNVTGYLIGGLIIGPSVLSILSAESIASLGIISQVALGFIAFQIGLSFKLSYFKRMGLTPIVIAILEASLATVFVTVALLIAGFELPVALILGAIASATAPAATVMVIKQYKARGPVTDTLLSVVAIDDAIALILFGFAAAIAQTILGTNASGSLLMTILSPVLEVLLALVIGAVVGFAMKYLLKMFPTRGARLSILIGGIFLITGISALFGASELLANMAGGMILVNISIDAQLMNEMIDNVTPPIYLMFFVISGARLQLSVVPTIGLIGIIYLVFRVLGKMAGAYVGARVMNASKNIQKYLGPMLLPQAGVAIGLATIAESIVPEYGSQITAVILVGTLIYELVGPVITKISLEKAKETNA